MIKTTIMTITLAALIAAGAKIIKERNPDKGDGVTQTLKKMQLCEKYHCELLVLAEKLELYDPKTEQSKVIYLSDRFILARLDSGDCIFVVRNGWLISQIVLLQSSEYYKPDPFLIKSEKQTVKPRVLRAEDLSDKDKEILKEKGVGSFNWDGIKTVRFSAKGEYVREINKLLQKHLSWYHPKQLDYFGKDTEVAVKDFQKQKHLGVDGIVGEGTKLALLQEPESQESQPETEEKMVQEKPLWEYFKEKFIETKTDTLVAQELKIKKKEMSFSF